MLIRGARVFNVYRRIFEEKEVLLRGGIFRDIGENIGEKLPAEGEEELDAGGLYLIPGLVDIHMHIESSMTIPGEFSRAVLPAGTCTVVADPHEIANVFGIEGIRRFMEARTPLDIFYGIPSSVPSTNPSLETTGGSIGPEEIAALAKDPRILCLGEIMNAKELCSELCSEPSPVSGPGSPAPGGRKNRTREILAAFRRERPFFPLEGHCPHLRGSELSAFIAAGVWSDHTLQDPESILEKVSKGMFLEIQRKSLTPENVKTMVENRLFEHLALVTDDVMPDELEEGHLNLLVKRAVELGMRPEDAICCATYTPSRHIGLRDRGAIAPGRIGDFVLLRDLGSFEIAGVYKGGMAVGKDGEPATERRPGAAPDKPEGRKNPENREKTSFPPHFYTSIRRAPLEAADFTPPLPQGFREDSINCVSIIPSPHSTATRRGRVNCRVSSGKLRWQEAGLSLLAVAERYGKGEPPALALTEWPLLKKGAIASSWAHDHHNLLILGNNEADMALAANRIIALQGGLAVAVEGRVTAEARLRVGGIVSDDPLPLLASQIRRVREAMIDLGYNRENAIMSFGTLSLLVSPELKISDQGIVDVKNQRILGFYEE
ncbi:MAG: amidohydrolase family protein [Treponema sp.]|jgi:adenine deaminase|nr:amidohydrolase family protein [Treponema sp.]